MSDRPRTGLPLPWAAHEDRTVAANAVVLAFFAVAAACALLAPQSLWLPLALAAAIGVVFWPSAIQRDQLVDIPTFLARRFGPSPHLSPLRAPVGGE